MWIKISRRSRVFVIMYIRALKAVTRIINNILQNVINQKYLTLTAIYEFKKKHEGPAIVPKNLNQFNIYRPLIFMQILSLV